METRSCLFTNICFQSSSKTWVYFVDPESATSLPADTLVNEDGNVLWSASDIFLKKSDWSINLSTSYKQEKSKYEADENKHAFLPPDVSNTAIPESVKWEERPHMMFSRTVHDDNAGHLVYDQYHHLITAIGSHLGMSESKNVVLVDVVGNKESFSHHWPGSYEKGWKYRIGRVLFNKEIRYNQFLAAAKVEPKMVCYRKLIAGCGRVAGMDGGVQSRQGSIHYIRDMLWQEYAPDNLTVANVDKNNSNVNKAEIIKDKVANIRILMIQKIDSSWGHLNLIKNWAEIVTGVEALKGVTVTHFVPKQCEFGQQVAYYKNADIIISLWGGISMLNFLMPKGGTEVLFTSWFSDNDMLLIPRIGSIDPVTKKNITEVPRLLKCPDFDERTRSALSDTSSIRFCSRTEGQDSYSVNMTNFLPLIEMVVKNQRWKKRNN